jgi:hypothetical protein
MCHHITIALFYLISIVIIIWLDVLLLLKVARLQLALAFLVPAHLMKLQEVPAVVQVGRLLGGVSLFLFSWVLNSFDTWGHWGVFMVGDGAYALAFLAGSNCLHFFDASSSTLASVLQLVASGFWNWHLKRLFRNDIVLKLGALL